MVEGTLVLEFLREFLLGFGKLGKFGNLGLGFVAFQFGDFVLFDFPVVLVTSPAELRVTSSKSFLHCSPSSVAFENDSLVSLAVPTPAPLSGPLT